MSSFQINGSDPPEGAIPRQSGYRFVLPEPVDSDALGRPVLQVDDLPWVEIAYERLNGPGWDFYCSFLEAHTMYAHLVSIRVPDFFDYTVPSGPNWVTYSGDGIYMDRPVYQAIEYGHFFGVSIMIKGLD